jgi:hypothetical protein
LSSSRQRPSHSPAYDGQSHLSQQFSAVRKGRDEAEIFNQHTMGNPIEKNFYDLIFKPKNASELGKPQTKGGLHGFEKDSADWEWRDQPEQCIEQNHPLRRIISETNMKNIPPVL